jgi:inorganic pyrophosphatase
MIGYRGSVVRVKALGAIALIDEGETDWKVLAIDVTDPLANEINDIDDLEKKMPGKEFSWKAELPILNPFTVLRNSFGLRRLVPNL